ncbi:MAG: hypothetical protein IJZ53_10400 [Tyzzerella sp.]|nr:hypothetical protein [Tyzzerella sp.]
MKKEKKIIVLVFTVLLALAAVVGGLWWMKNAKASWYDVNATEFTITTADELYDLAELSETYDFKGQTIKLGADIVVNEGDAEEWVEKAPRRRWHPISGFAGTFDGQGHSISGIYGDGIVTSMGLFTDTKKSSVIRDFQLVNSYFKNGNDKGTGSIIGFGGGTLESVYSDAIIEGSGQYFGGLIGKLTVKAENKVSNCWFDGTITMRGTESSYIGGLVGSIEVADAMNLIEHSLNTGDIVSEGNRVGGILGSVAKGGFLRLDDSMSSGIVTYGEEAVSIGSVIGEVDDSSSAFIADTYTVKEIKKETIGTATGKLNGNVISKKEELLTGFGGYQWTTLDFDNYWAVKLDDTPVLMSFAKELPSLAGITKKVDMSWYDSSKSEFVITTAEQLYGFSFLSISETFNGKTIKLGADITVNEGDANDWRENPPIYDWSPIGWHGTNTGQHFTGTFDGQGYTISGIYVKGDENEQYLGLFGEIYRTGTLKNLKLTNSYFEGTRDIAYQGIVGSIAGRNIGTIDTVYSDAIVVNSAKYTGGLVGMITGDGENLITNSWYDGQLYATTNSGGILGGVYGNRKNITATMQHCLNTGKLIISDDSTQIGGLCGVVQQGATLNLTDSLNTGTIEANDTVTKYGSVMGAVAEDKGGVSHGIASSAYGIKEFSTKTIGYFNGAWTGHCANVDVASIKGFGGYQWTTLDFDNYWAIRKNDTPILASFADSRPSVKGIARMVDVSWYDENKKEFTISTVAQLYGFAQLTKTLSFEGKTIKLGADIAVNQGNAADWAKNPPANTWTPMGYQASRVGEHFKGTFDGQGHTISGIYVKGNADEEYLGLFGEVYRGATVKNLKLTNSYIEGNRDSSKRGCVGSIAGRALDMTMDSVYSDAILANTAKMTGGLVGMITDDGNSKISNSWFAGELHSASNSGGIIGSIYGNKKKMSVTIENCLNTGTFHISDGATQIGGFVGVVQQKGVLKLSDSLNAGTIVTTGKVSKIGNAIGAVAKDSGGISTASLNQVYGVKEFSKKTVAYCNAEKSETEIFILDREYFEGYDGYRYTQLDFENYWVTEKVDATPVLSKFAGSDKVDMTGVIRANTSWYKNGNTINNASDLYGFTLLSKTNDFEGETIKLGYNITINKGSAADWAKNPPVKNEWMPIGYQGTESHFKGIFDGQGYSISGIYTKGEVDESYIGLFGEIYRGATVSNLTITNSYFEGTRESSARGCVGSLAGRALDMTIDSVYSDAIVVNSSRMTGGLVGMVTDDGDSKITNCWFAGELHSTTNTGGILGGVYGNKKEMSVTMEHCLNTGDLYISGGEAGASQIGGFVGVVQQLGVLYLNDSLNTGTIKTTGEVEKIGTAIGAVAKDTGGISVADLNKVYGAKEFASKMVGYSKGATLTENETSVSDMTSLAGYSGRRLTKLNFEKFWVIQNEKATPVLASFVGKDSLDMSVVVKPDTSWYEEHKEDKEFTINKAEELYGLAELSRDYDFSGWTIKLGQTITLNNKTVEQMKETAPANVWTPIGHYADGTGEEFKGTFDGQNFAIKGIYAVTNEAQYLGLFGTVGAGGTVQNLAIEESYFKNISGLTDGAYTGSIAGLLHGKIDTVKSTAIIESSSQYTGGLVGAILGSDECVDNDEIEDYTVTNSWFAGKVTSSTQKVAGIVGGINAKAFGKAFEATISHCLNSGTICLTGQKQTNVQQYGGLCGLVANKAELVMEDSLNAGELELKLGEGIKESGNSGSVIGLVSSATAKLTNAYGYAEEGKWYNQALKNSKSTVTGHEDAEKTMNELTGKNAYLNMNLDFCLNEADSTGYWIVTDGTPILRSFKGNVIAMDLTALTDARTVWYDAKNTDNEYTIYTVADLYGLSELSATNDFKNETIILGADITLNEGLYSKIDNNQLTGLNEWVPIGDNDFDADDANDRKQFLGTFDGDSHTISGLYATVTTSDSAQQYLGLFGTIGKGGTVQDLKITESYFKNTAGAKEGAFTGSVTGLLYGTLDTVKSDAKLYSTSQYTGGLVGTMRGSGDGGDYTIINCWFVGELNINSQKAAGLVGGINGKDVNENAHEMNVTISNCLSSGATNIFAGTSTSQNGGLIGAVLYKAKLNLSNCLYTGTLTIASGASSSTSGSVIGLLQGSVEDGTYAELTSVYVNSEWSRAIAKIYQAEAKVEDYEVVVTGGKKQASPDNLNTIDSYIEKTATELTGDNAKNLNLEFYDSTVNKAGYWVVLDSNSTPVLCEFAGYQRAEATPVAADTSWYETHKEDKTVTISSAAELYGLSELSKENDFSGWTIKLGADITLNNKTAEQMAAKKPLNVWTPIGYYDMTEDAEERKEFRGTFDGDGHVISGIYVSTDKQWRVGLFGTVGAGGVVKNLEIKESYFNNSYPYTKNYDAYLGSVTGVLHGTLNTIYSNASIYSNSQYNGGIVGGIIGSTECDEDDYTIKNCWFDGTITSGQQKTAGIVGGINDTTSAGNIIVQISHCLNSADIVATANKQQQIGGLCGVLANGAELIIEDSLNVGKSILQGTGASGNTASIIGLITNATATLTNVYGCIGDADETIWYNQAVKVSTAKGNTASLTINNVTTKDVDTINSYAGRTMEQLTGLTDEDKKDLLLDFYSTSNTTGKWDLNNGQPVLYDFKKYLWTVETE